MQTETAPSAVPAIVGGILGVVLGMTSCGGAATVASYLWVKKAEVEVRKGWNLVPVAEAKRDLAPGEVVQLADIEQRSVPEQFVTASLVLPAQVSLVVGQEVTVPVARGTPLRHTFFMSAEGLSVVDDLAVIDACSAELTRRGQGSSEWTGADIRARLKQAGGQ